MRRLLFKIVERIRSSYWFVPSIMALAASILAFVLVYIDGVVGTDWVDGYSWIYANKPDGARDFLSTVAGSMITVAGVTFSITIASVVYATSLFGPRLLTNFMRDRGNQVTLGTFIATFLYCLLVLRTVRAADETLQAGSAASTTGAFVPHLAMLGALLLAIASVGVLIYFIHHVPEQIHAGRVVANIGRELVQALESLFPETLGMPQPVDKALIEEMCAAARAIPASASGYVQYLDGKRLFKTACACDAVLFVETVPGDFAHDSLPVALVWPPQRLTAELEDKVLGAFNLGAIRTPAQDSRFLADELVEVGARALSPGINDPFTAMNCLQWLTSAAVALAQRSEPQPYRFDEQGHLRLVSPTITFETLVTRAFDGMRPYVAKDRNAALHQMRLFDSIAQAVTRTEDAQTLAALVARFHAEARPNLIAAEDIQTLDVRRDAVFERLRTREALPVPL